MRDSADELVTFWKKFETSDSGRRIHPDDETGLAGHESSVANLEDYFHKLKADDEGTFHTALAPVPYLGDLRRADIVLLMLNPVVGPADYATDANGQYQAGLQRTLRQNVQESQTCLALDPKYTITSWFWYYERLFRRVLLNSVEHGFCNNYGTALETLAKRLAIVELVPYYSTDARRFGASWLSRLASAGKARSFARELLKEAKLGRTTLIVRWNGGSNDYWNLGTNTKGAVMISGFNSFYKATCEPIQQRLWPKQ